MNLYTNQRSFTARKKIGVLIGVISLLAGLVFFQSTIKNIFYTITAPVSGRLWQAGISSAEVFDVWFNAGGLIQENKNLKEENEKLLSDTILLRQTIAENQLTKALAQNTQNSNFKTVLAQTIGLAQDVVFLNKGFDDGVLENMPVISSERVLYGRVNKVYKNFSSVLLISHPDSVVDVKIEAMENENPVVLGVLKGSGDLEAYLDLVAQDAELHEGDSIVTSGQEGFFPRNLLVGKVIKSSKNDAKPFQTASVRPLFDIRHTDTLFVITNYKREK